MKNIDNNSKFAPYVIEEAITVTILKMLIENI